jgi:hypothetical protein
MTGEISVDRMALPEAIERLQDHHEPAMEIQSRDSPVGREWDLGVDFTQARKLATLGWNAQAHKLLRRAEVLRFGLDSSVSNVFDVSGDAVDVGRFLSHEPECMFAQQVSEERSISVLVNISASAGAKAECLFNRGVAVAALVRAIQSTARSVSVSVGVSTHGGDNPSPSEPRHVTIVNIQGMGELMHPGRIAFWISHPAALRRCFLRFMEQQPVEIRRKIGITPIGRYGTPCEIPAQCVPENALYIPFLTMDELNEQYGDPVRSLQTLMKELESRKVPLQALV